jgi:hypothetical protein
LSATESVMPPAAGRVRATTPPIPRSTSRTAFRRRRLAHARRGCGEVGLGL